MTARPRRRRTRRTPIRQAGQYTARLTVSDGIDTTQSSPITIRVGNAPTATILSPQDGSLFRAGDVITFIGDATDVEDGPLPASAYTWNIDFLHEGHVHPGTPITGVKSGTFTIPTSGHDFSGNTRYRITLTVTDSDGLTTTRAVTIYPDKVNLTFNTAPSGLTLYLDGIARTTPFVHDTLVGFTHTIEARNQTSGAVATRSHPGPMAAPSSTRSWRPAPPRATSPRIRTSRPPQHLCSYRSTAPRLSPTRARSR